MGRSNADHARSGPVLCKVRDCCGGKDGPATAVGAAAGRTQIHLAGGQSQVGRPVSKLVFRGQQDGGSLMEPVRVGSRDLGRFGPTWVVDTQNQGESTPVAGFTAGDGHCADNLHLVLLTVLRQVKGFWEKLRVETEDEERQLLLKGMFHGTFPGTESSPSAQRRNSGFPSVLSCCCCC